MDKRLKELRKSLGLSQGKFSTKINKSPGFIERAEQNAFTPSEDAINAICSTFGVRKEWLLHGTGSMFTKGNACEGMDIEGAVKRIREIRAENGLTQEEFGTQMGYSKNQIRFVESGKVKPTYDLLCKISYAFSVNLTWMMSGNGERDNPNAKEVLDEPLIEWIRQHPEVIHELRIRSGLVVKM